MRRKNTYYLEEHVVSTHITGGRTRKHYGLFKFVVDCVLTVISGGLWLIWIFVREMRRR